MRKRVVSSDPADAQAQEPNESLTYVQKLDSLMLVPTDELELDPTVHARPGPEPADEPAQLRRLGKSLKTTGQWAPLIVRKHNGRWRIVIGSRRFKAAQVEHIPELMCLEAPVSKNDDELTRAAIHENIKRRGLSHLQFAHLCKELRDEHGWTSAQEVADYLGCSRAQVTQHDKLLRKPDGMPQATYDELIDKLANGRLGADAAFYTLSHVVANHTDVVLERAKEIALEESGQVTTTDAPSDASASSDVQESASVQPPEPPQPKVTRKHIQKAARETKTEKLAKRNIGVERTMDDLRVLFDDLRSCEYPDVMRSFITTLAAEWWRGDATDDQVVKLWSEIAGLVEESIQRRERNLPVARKTITNARHSSN